MMYFWLFRFWLTWLLLFCLYLRVSWNLYFHHPCTFYLFQFYFPNPILYTRDNLCLFEERWIKKQLIWKWTWHFAVGFLDKLIVVVPYFESRLTPRINIPLLTGTVYPTPKNITRPLPPGSTSGVSSGVKSVKRRGAI